MHIVEKRNLWFTISLLAVLPGIFYMVWSVFATGSPLPLSIDFTGGTVWDIRLAQEIQDPLAAFDRIVQHEVQLRRLTQT